MEKIGGFTSIFDDPPKIIYEDDDLLVVNKPAGLVVNRSATVEEETLQDWLIFRHPALTSRHPEPVSGSLSPPPRPFGEIPKRVRDDGELSVSHDNIKKDFFSRAGIVHRLDKETSGVLLVAKNPPAFADLQRQFKERLVKKTYIALVHGLFSFKTGEISVPLGRDPKNRQRFAVVPGGRPAVTKYRVLQFLEERVEERGDLGRRGRLGIRHYTLLQLEPLTGRTHQLRVHLAHLHHPVVADPWYGGRKTSRQDHQLCPRLFLHAQSLGFTHPATGVWLKIEAELPEDLRKVLQSFRPVSSS